MHQAKDYSSSAQPSAPDQSLLHRYRSGEQDAATELYLRYSARLQSLAASQTPPSMASRFDPEDVVQSVFRTLFRRVSEGMYDVPPGDELWSLLLVIALNKIRKLATRHRAQKRDVTRTLGSTTLETPGQQPQTNDETSLTILKLVIDDLMRNLPPANRSIVQLRIDGHRADDIAEQTERSKRTVERVLRDFRTELSAKIYDEMDT